MSAHWLCNFRNIYCIFSCEQKKKSQSLIDITKRTREPGGNNELLFTRTSSQQFFVSTAFNPFPMHRQTATKNYFHNKTPTSGGNILIFMLPKHEKELRLLWYTRAKKKIEEKKSSNKRKKSFFFDIRRRKKSPSEYIYWKNILWMVYHLRKTIMLLSVLSLRLFSPLYTRGLKVVNFLAALKKTKFFISSNIHWVVLVFFLCVWRIFPQCTQQRQWDFEEISLEHKRNTSISEVFINWFIWSSNPFIAN